MEFSSPPWRICPELAQSCHVPSSNFVRHVGFNAAVTDWYATLELSPPPSSTKFSSPVPQSLKLLSYPSGLTQNRQNHLALSVWLVISVRQALHVMNCSHNTDVGFAEKAKLPVTNPNWKLKQENDDRK